MKFRMASPTERVARALQANGVEVQVLEFPQGTRTARDAAAAVGTTVARIVKSLVYLSDGRPMLVLISGANRVDPLKLGRAAGATTVTRATPDEVRRSTGFAIGGVPPVGHDTRLPVYIDQDLMQYDTVYAAAGTPNTVFAIDPRVLRQITEGQIGNLREG